MITVHKMKPNTETGNALSLGVSNDSYPTTWHQSCLLQLRWIYMKDSSVSPEEKSCWLVMTLTSSSEAIKVFGKCMI